MYFFCLALRLAYEYFSCIYKLSTIQKFHGIVFSKKYMQCTFQKFPVIFKTLKLTNINYFCGFQSFKITGKFWKVQCKYFLESLLHGISICWIDLKGRKYSKFSFYNNNKLEYLNKLWFIKFKPYPSKNEAFLEKETAWHLFI